MKLLFITLLELSIIKSSYREGWWSRVQPSIALGKKYQESRTEPKIPRTEPKIPKPNFSVPYSVPNSQEPKLLR